MTNISIKKILLLFWQGYMWICTVAFTTSLLGIFTIFGTNFLSIDSCLDRGGVWHYKVEQCAETQEELDALIEKFGPVRPED